MPVARIIAGRTLVPLSIEVNGEKLPFDGFQEMKKPKHFKLL